MMDHEQLQPADAGRLDRLVLQPVDEGAKTTPRERPILFSAPMVRALLAGTKTQTRRALSPDLFISSGGAIVRMASAGPATTGISKAHCPYWRKPGDRLWVREAFRFCAEADSTPPRDTDAAYRVWYEAEAPHQQGAGKLRPGMFMPRWASRLTLEVTGVRVERLKDISRGDAMAEGCPFPNMAKGADPRQWYADLWVQINGAGSWGSNPHVWVLEFRKLQNVEVSGGL